MTSINSIEDLLKVLEDIRQNRLCCYMNSLQYGCDCKYSNIKKMKFSDHGEDTGCPEMRDAIGFIEDHLMEVPMHGTLKGRLVKWLKKKFV